MIKVPFDIEDLIDDLRIFSWEANDILVRYHKMLRDPKNKSNIIENRNINDPVTTADIKVNELIIQRINDKYKNINWQILSEENTKVDSLSCKLNSDWIWILDPLDGTKEFIKGSDEYTVNIALIEEETPILGIVYVPEKDEIFWNDSVNSYFGNKGNKRKIFVSDDCEKISKLELSRSHLDDLTKNFVGTISYAN